MIGDIKKMMAQFMKEDTTAKEAKQVKDVMHYEDLRNNKFNLTETEQNDYNRFRDNESAINNNKLRLDQEAMRQQQQHLMDQMKNGQFGIDPHIQIDPNIQRINPQDPFISHIGSGGYVTYSSNNTGGPILPGGGEILSQVNYEYTNLEHLSEKDQDTYKRHLSIYLHAMDCMDRLLTGDGPKEIEKGKKLKLFKK